MRRTLAAVFVLLGGLIVAGHATAAPIWCSPFETESGAPVSQDQVADVVDNPVGSPGAATGSLANLDPLIYIQHGQFIPSIPSAIDPAGQAASFAISTPDDRRTGINTGVRSDVGNLATDLTFEGYFYMADGAPVLSPTLVGRRLVTQKRSADDANSRLAIGVHATLTGMVDGLFEIEGADYVVGETPIPLAGLNGGTGWGAAWINSSDTYRIVSGSLSSPASAITPVGNRISTIGGATAVAARALGRKVDLSADGNNLYFSVLVRKSENGSSARNLEINLTPASTSTQTARFGMNSAGQFFLHSTSNLGGSITPNETYLMIGRIASNASAADQLYMNVYGSEDDPPPALEPENWLLTYSIGSSVTLENIRLVAGSGIIGDFDEIRIGSTWESVTDPDALLGDPGELANTLSVYWAEEVPGVEPEEAPTVVNHLEFGTTPLEGQNWYHFALTYDGQDIRWYLDGQQEGIVPAPPSTETTAGLHPVGPATLALANNRSFGATDDRGFFGVLDEIRVWDTALAPSGLAVQGGLPGEGLLWRSRFETNSGLPVSSSTPAETPNCIDNEVGPPNGTPAGVLASYYTAYGQPNVPAIPSAIDPAGLAEGFAFYMPTAPTTAINTQLPSNTRGFADAMTAQGYFSSFYETPVGVSAVGARLVSTMRSAVEGQARLGIGLAANPSPPPGGPPNVLAVAYYSTAASAVLVEYGTTPIEIGTWYHFGLVWDGTDIRFYLNGQLEGQIIGTTLIGPGSAPIAIGNDRTAGNGTRGFYGLLDKIVISDHVIAPEDFMTAGRDPCAGVWCNMPFADFNYDGYVDMLDFSELQRCLTVGGGELSPACACADRNEDGVADLLDVAEFAKCATGPGVVWSVELVPDCVP